MSYAYYCLASWALMLVCGLPLARFCLPASLLRYRLALAPSLGFCYIIVASYFCYRLDLPGTDFYAAPVLLLPMIVLLSNVARLSPDGPSHLAERFATHVDSFIALGLFLAALIIAALPDVLINKGHPLAISLGNLDLADLSCASRFIQEFPRGWKEGFLGQSGVFQWISDDVWFGPSGIVAFSSSILGSTPYKLQSLVMYVAAAQGVVFLFIILQELLDFSRISACFLGLLYAANPILLYTEWEGFGGQIVSMPLVLGTLLVCGLMLKGNILWNQSGRYVLVLFVFESGILVSYHYILLITLALVICYVAAHAVISRDFKTSCRVLAIAGISTLVTCAFNPLRVKSLINLFGLVKGANAGWFIPWVGPDLLLGFNASSQLLGMPANLPRPWAIGFAAIIVLLNLGYLFINRRREPRQLTFYLGLVLPVFVLTILFALPTSTNALFGGYRSYKVASAFIGVSLVGNLLFLSAFKNKQYFAVIIAAVALFISYFTFRSSTDIANFKRTYAYVLPKEVIDLQTLESNPAIPGLNILSADNNTLIWINYFTLRKPQIYQGFPYGRRVVGRFNPEYYFLAKTNIRPTVGTRTDIFSVTATKTSERTQISQSFYIYRSVGQQSVILAPLNGWWGSEGTHRWGGKSGTSVSITLDAEEDNTKVSIAAKYSPLQVGDRFSAIFQGKPLLLKEGPGEFLSESISLHKGKNVISFTNTVPPGKPSASDPRTLGVLWTDISVSVFPSN